MLELGGFHLDGTKFNKPFYPIWDSNIDIDKFARLVGRCSQDLLLFFDSYVLGEELLDPHLDFSFRSFISGFQVFEQVNDHLGIRSEYDYLGYVK